MVNRAFKYGSLTMLTAIIVLAGVLACRLAFMQETNVIYDVAGWLWSDNYGWISLNYQNPGLPESGDTRSYKIQLDSNNNLSGYGWSEYVGWVCFGFTCSGSGIGGIPSFDGGWDASYDPIAKKITGWAGIVSLGNEGYLHLGGTVIDGSLANGVGQACYDCNTNNEEGSLNCRSCFARVRVDGENIPDTSVTSTSAGSGSICFNCNGCQTSTNPLGTASRIICTGGCSGGCKKYGTIVNGVNGTILGWGWNGDSTNLIGAGWVEFNGAAEIVYPWLQTQFGSVYGSNYIRQRFEKGRNATYCIFAKDVYSFTSTNCQQPFFSDVAIAYPTLQNGVYRNALGQIDLAGLTTEYRRIGNTRYNKYDQVLNIYNNATTWKNSEVFNNSVYVIKGNLTIDAGFAIANGGNGQRGNGLVVVDGDLNIKSDFGYSNGSLPDDLKKLGSVAWVIKGDVIVDPTVTKIVGAYLLLGKDGILCQTESGSSADYPKYIANGCGVFFSNESPNQLVTLGLIIARAFDFRRTYSKLIQGSERIIYDGRLIANPPPGLKALAENLPVIRDYQY